MTRLVWIPVLLIGVICGLVVSTLPKLEIKPEIRLDSLATVLVSIVVFAVVQVIYHRQSSDRRIERDLLIGLVKDALASTGALNDTFENVHMLSPLPEDAVQRIHKRVQNFSNSIHSIEQALGECKIDKDKVGFPDIQSAREEYRDVLTDTPFPTSYAPGIYRTQQSHHKKIRDGLYRLMFNLNRQ